MKQILKLALEYVKENKDEVGGVLSGVNSINDLEDEIEESLDNYTFEQPENDYGGSGGGDNNGNQEGGDTAGEQDVIGGDDSVGRINSDGSYSISCLDYKNKGINTDGVYRIDPDGAGNAYEPQNETVLLIKSNNTNGTTSIVDSAKSKTVTKIGNVEHSSTKSAYGISSIYFDGDSDGLKLSDSEDWNMGGGSYTVDFWINTTQTTKGTLIRQYEDVGGGVLNGWYITINDGNDIYAYIGDDQGSSKSLGGTAGNLNDGQWHHIALVNKGYNNNVNLYVDGTQVVSKPLLFNMVDVNGELKIGKSEDGLTDFDGYMENIRVTKGLALWTSNFTPPPKPMKAYCDMTTDGGGWTIVFKSSNVSNWKTNFGTPGLDEWGHDFSSSSMSMSELLFQRVETGEYMTLNGINTTNLYQCSNIEGTFYWDGSKYNRRGALHLGISDSSVGKVSGPDTGYILVGGSCNNNKRSWGFGHRGRIDDVQGYGWDSNQLGEQQFLVGVR